jgi:hypothetical protein
MLLQGCIVLPSKLGRMPEAVYTLLSNTAADRTPLSATCRRSCSSKRKLLPLCLASVMQLVSRGGQDDEFAIVLVACTLTKALM